MSGSPDTERVARHAESVYRDKARTEIAQAEALVTGKGSVRGQGDLLAEVLLIKGEPGQGDLSTGRALSGDDGVAIGKALDALDLPKARFAFCTRGGRAPARARISRVRLMTEAVDPGVIVLLDTVATADFAAAFGVDAPAPGVLTKILGRTVVALTGFEASLTDEAAKRQAWKQLQALGGHPGD